MTDAAETTAPVSTRQLRADVRHLALAPEPVDARPRTRGDCADGERPCPYVSCHHHLYLRVSKSGIIRHNFPGLEPDQLDQLTETCALDVAEDGGATLDEVGIAMGVSRERVRQIEEEALAKLKTFARDDARSLREFWDDDGEP